ncbi:Rha family transcriptional regulator [Acinetobacter qingfengensis]|uniref:Rha family transcriptional regulator n=1 Tax=Acinetobacter qingfengensis TaxID=1262585 RepID=A0A1E7R2P8_9GAMM|nr:Rha family transcriptional regulator [Acinetobacter qingfengensis]KAA8733889.1 Rha family transcriptional regulator [Acinetobacter qingfengensis]OEY93599.1 Rha family transcriptional regulator [Acinetobacter qingfengensis]
MNAITQLDDAVFIHDQQVKTNSLKVAEIFKKRHDNVLQKIESILAIKSSALNFQEAKSNALNFEVVEFNQRNFTLVEYLDEQGKPRPMYEMTKDGFIFLVMGFTGEEAALTKIAYINTFNQMAAMLHNVQGNLQHIHVGAAVQLKSGGPLYTVSRIHYDQNGFMQDAEVMWHDKAKLCRETIPVACLSLEQKNLIQNKTLGDFWQSINHYGIDKLNHSRDSRILALNITQLYQSIEGLPAKTLLQANLMQSRSPYPIYMQHNHAVSSIITGKTVKCWIFDARQQHVLEHTEYPLG